MKLPAALLTVLLSVGLVGCSSLKPIQAYSTAVVTGFGQASTLPATFTDVYRLRTVEDSLGRHPFNRIPLIGLNFTDRVRADSLRIYQRADSLTRALTRLLAAYFQTINNLAGSGSVLSPTPLIRSPSFDSFLQSSAVKLTVDQTVAANQLASVLGALATNRYRRRQLARLLNESRDAVDRVLGAQAFAYGRLADVVDISRDQQYNQYKNVLIRDPKLTYLQKRDLARQWLQTEQIIEQNRQAVQRYVAWLKTVQAGHDVLYWRRDMLSRQSTAAALAPFTATLNTLPDDLAQLRTTNTNGRLYP